MKDSKRSTDKSQKARFHTDDYVEASATGGLDSPARSTAGSLLRDPCGTDRPVLRILGHLPTGCLDLPCIAPSLGVLDAHAVVQEPVVESGSTRLMDAFGISATCH
jgi:hypothetical protein